VELDDGVAVDEYTDRLKPGKQYGKNISPTDPDQ
jgi:hypothetical protein